MNSKLQFLKASLDAEERKLKRQMARQFFVLAIELTAFALIFYWYGWKLALILFLLVFSINLQRSK